VKFGINALEFWRKLQLPSPKYKMEAAGFSETSAPLSPIHTLTLRHIPPADFREAFYGTNCYRLIRYQPERSYDHSDGIIAYFTDVPTIPIAIPCALAYLFRHSA
jgi:hypothetical protein